MLRAERIRTSVKNICSSRQRRTPSLLARQCRMISATFSKPAFCDMLRPASAGAVIGSTDAMLVRDALFVLGVDVGELTSTWGGKLQLRYSKLRAQLWACGCVVGGEQISECHAVCRALLPNAVRCYLAPYCHSACHVASKVLVVAPHAVRVRCACRTESAACHQPG